MADDTQASAELNLEHVLVAASRDTSSGIARIRERTMLRLRSRLYSIPGKGVQGQAMAEAEVEAEVRQMVPPRLLVDRDPRDSRPRGRHGCLH